jgi:putative transposase
MPNYRRLHLPGRSYFFTHVTYQRHPWLCTDLGRQALREAIITVRQKHPFAIDAFVLLPDHFHCILTLPKNDADYAKRWRLIKLMVTKACGKELALPLEKSPSGERRGEGKLWQRRYWEHCIRGERDFLNCCEYIHYNPVKHGLVESPTDWEFSSVHRFLGEGE